MLPIQILPQYWTQIENFPGTARDDAVSFQLDNYVFVGTGMNNWWGLEKDFYRFSLLTESWETVAGLPVGMERQYACGFAYENSGYVFGGIRNGNYLGDLLRYDAGLNSWTELSNSLDSGIMGASVIQMDSLIYIVGGRTNQTTASNVVWQYNIASNNWSLKDTLPFGGRWRSSSTSFNGFGYLFGGIDEGGKLSNKLYRYNHLLDDWMVIDTFPGKGRTYSKMKAYKDGLLIAGGLDSSGESHNDFWYYNVLTENWKELWSLPSLGFRGGILFTDGQVIYYTTGIDNEQQKWNACWKNENILDIPTQQDNFAAKAFPNPNHGTLYFSKMASGKVFDLHGKLIFEFQRQSCIDLPAYSPNQVILQFDGGGSQLILNN